MGKNIIRFYKKSQCTSITMADGGSLPSGGSKDFYKTINNEGLFACFISLLIDLGLHLEKTEGNSEFIEFVSTN